VIAGAGVTGCEISSELASEYGTEKEIILLVKGGSVLENAPVGVQSYVLKEMQNLKIDVKLQTVVSGVVETGRGGAELTLSNGNKLLTDLYVPTFGITPNSSYVPHKFLNTGGYVMVDECLQVKGAKNVWALGDISDTEWSQFIWCDRQSIHIAKTMVLIMSNKDSSTPYKHATSRIMGLSLGKNAGTGHWGTFQMPTFVIKWIRKTLFIENMGKTLDGSMF
jgi:NADH dehydrogenase FAD-containing subunit